MVKRTEDKYSPAACAAIWIGGSIVGWMLLTLVALLIVGYK